MAKVIRRGGLRLGLFLLIVAMVILSWGLPGRFLPSGVSPSHAQEAGAPLSTRTVIQSKRQLTPTAYSQIQQLREEVYLTNFDLAAMACNRNQAEQALDNLVQWYEANHTDLEQFVAQENQAQDQLRQALRRVNVGPRDPALLAQLPSFRTQCTAAKERRQQLIATAGQAATLTLTTPQRQMHETASANPGVPLWLRYVPGVADTNGPQGQTMKPVGSVRKVPTQLTDLTVAQRQTVTEVAARTQQSMTAVSEAEEACLPEPEELRRLNSSVGTGVSGAVGESQRNPAP